LAWPVSAFAHAWHWPAQATLQQKLSTQWLLVQSPLALQAEPLARSAGSQVPALQLPLWQSLFWPHCLVLAHFVVQSGPPQSVSVSLPSLVPSVQPLTHDPLVQR